MVRAAVAHLVARFALRLEDGVDTSEEAVRATGSALRGGVRTLLPPPPLPTLQTRRRGARATKGSRPRAQVSKNTFAALTTKPRQLRVLVKPRG